MFSIKNLKLIIKPTGKLKYNFYCTPFFYKLLKPKQFKIGNTCVNNVTKYIKKKDY